MDNESSVFRSCVPVKEHPGTDLYELLIIPHSQPISSYVQKHEIPSTIHTAKEKNYVQRTIFKKKVKTVRQIRKEYESYIYETLNVDLHRQHKYIFDNICRGSVKEDVLSQRGKKILDSKNPIMRLTWQMLTNLNIDNKPFPKQYVSLDRRDIVVSGSKGGPNKYLCNYDSNLKVIKSSSNYMEPRNFSRLLKTSLKVHYKPGPLTKKEKLDVSYQKFSLGATTPVILPEIGLKIRFSNGVPVNSRICGFIQSMRERNGLMTEEWINFATTAMSNEEIGDTVTFRLKYKNDQKKILMRKQNIENESQKILKDSPQSFKFECDEKHIKSCLDEIISAVEISVMQDQFISEDDNFPTGCDIEENIGRPKERPNLELKKLDVTIIHVSDDTDEQQQSKCLKSFCTMGCICSSLLCKLQFKTHCARTECMFKCVCDFTKYNIKDANYDTISNLVRIGKLSNPNMAKEEKKFHHTVLVSENKTPVVLSSRNHNGRMPKKYINNIELNNIKRYKVKSELIIRLPYIDCSNVEMWCMVHEVYRCFCNGKFLYKLDNTILDVNDNANKRQEIVKQTDLSQISDNLETKRTATKNFSTDSKNELSQDEITETRKHLTGKNKACEPEVNEIIENASFGNAYPADDDDFIDVVTVEEVSKRVICESDHFENSSRESQKDLSESEQVESCSRTKPYRSLTDKSKSMNTSPKDKTNLLSKKFADWLEKSYILIKKKMDDGQTIILDAPQPHKMAIFPWSVLLKRFELKNNYFLVKISPPHRVVISIEATHAELENYVDINKIPIDDLANLHLPDFVKQLVSKTEIENSFVLLQGSCNYWEILGLVKKNGSKLIPNNSNVLKQSTNFEPSETNLLSIDKANPYNCASANSLHMETNIGTKDVTTKHHVENKRTPRLRNRPKKFATEEWSQPERKSLKPQVNKRPNKSNQIPLYSRKYLNPSKVISRDKKIFNSINCANKMNTSRDFLKLEPKKIKNRDNQSNNEKFPNLIEQQIYQSISSANQVNTQVSQELKPCANKTDKKQSNGETITKSFDQEIYNSVSSASTINKVNDFQRLQPNENKNSRDQSNIDKKSKWFVMTIENDFEQLLFPGKNFFVTYETIGCAIKCARNSQQTVFLPLAQINYRISPQFGIYALPDEETECVLIGPYNYYDDLQMTAVKRNEVSTNKKTRGVWMYTKTVDNNIVLNDPLSYLNTISREKNDGKRKLHLEDTDKKLNRIKLPKIQVNFDGVSTLKFEIDEPELKREIGPLVKTQSIELNIENSSVSGFVNEVPTSSITDSEVMYSSSQESDPETIMETLTSELSHGPTEVYKDHSIISKVIPLKRFKSSKSKLIKVMKPLKNDNVEVSSLKSTCQFSQPAVTVELPNSGISHIPLYSHPIITNVSSLANSSKKNEDVNPNSLLKSSVNKAQSKLSILKAKESDSAVKRFVILKPNEINNKIISSIKESNEGSSAEEPNLPKLDQGSKDSVHEDRTAAASVIAVDNDSDDEVLIISDQEDNNESRNTYTNIETDARDVILACVNLPCIGGIRARLNEDNKISFQFPGFKFSEFYSKEEAYTKVNQVLSRKVFVPKALTLKWRVSPVGSRRLLSTTELSPDHVVTKMGIVHKKSVKFVMRPSVPKSDASNGCL